MKKIKSLLFSEGQPLILSAYYLIFTPLILSSIVYFTYDSLASLPDINLSVLTLAIILITNIFLLPKYIRFVDKSSTKRPLTPFEAMISFTLFFMLSAFGVDAYFSDILDLAIFNYFANLAVCILGVIINYRVQVITYFQSNNNSDLNSDDLSRIVEKTIKSDAFISAVQTVLPESETSKDKISRHFPFMLGVINKRRESYRKTSQLFFITLIIFTLLSTVLVTSFGYILIDTSDIGSVKSIQNVEREFESFNAARLDFIDLSEELINLESKTGDLLIENTEFVNKSNIEPGISDYYYSLSRRYLRDLTYTSQKRPTDITNESINFRFETLKETLENLRTAIEENSISEEKNTILNRTPVNSINSLLKKVKSYQKDISDITKDYTTAKSVIKTIIEKAEKDISKDENRWYNLLKRLSVGIIIGSFFIAILKYISTQYKQNLKLLNEAEKDEMTIRKFYIAYDVAGDEKTSEILNSFVNESIEKEVPSTTNNEKKLDEGDKKIISEILEILKKKI